MHRKRVCCLTHHGRHLVVVYSAGQGPGGAARESSTDIVEGVGLMLFAIYHVVIIIVLINMLIAMMSHSFEAIQVRISLFVSYIILDTTYSYMYHYGLVTKFFSVNNQNSFV